MKSRTISLRMPLWFIDGAGSLRLNILCESYLTENFYTFAISVYQKGRLVEEQSSPSVLKTIRRIVHWYDKCGTKPEVQDNAKD